MKRRRQLAKARRSLKVVSSAVPTFSTSIQAAKSPMADTSTETNILVSMTTLQSHLNSMARFAHCDNGKLSLSVSNKSHGSASYVSIACNGCRPYERGADGAVPRSPGLQGGTLLEKGRARYGPHGLGRPMICVIKCPTSMY